MPGPSSATVRVARPPSTAVETRTGVPGGRVHEGVLDQDPADLEHPLLRRPARACPAVRSARAGARRRPRAARTRPRARRRAPPRSSGSRATRQPAGVEAREVEQVGRELRQPGHLLAHLSEELVAASPRRDSGRRAARGSRPSEKSGVRSSCEALAMNSPRARSRFASRRRIRSNARASWPTSSMPWSTTGSSKLPLGDPLGRRLEPPDPAREQARAGVAEEHREDVARAPATSTRRRTTATACSWSCSERREQHDDVADRVGHLGVASGRRAGRSRARARGAGSARRATGSFSSVRGVALGGGVGERPRASVGCSLVREKTTTRAFVR